MAQTLIVPDIHERLHKLYNIEEVYMEQADHVVMLGDFWDTFNPVKEAEGIADWVKAHAQDDKFEFMWGNHDAHYAFKGGGFKCSGYQVRTQLVLDKMMTLAEWRRFKLHTRVGKFLISHAGYHPNTIGMLDQAQTAIDAAFTGGFHPLWAPGLCVGGPRTGGPTWLRWQCEYMTDSLQAMEQAQIVGHSTYRAVQTKTWQAEPPSPLTSTSYCLDTGLKHLMWTDGDKVEIVTI